MLSAARSCFADRLWGLSFSGIVLLGFAVASLAPYRSIIGIERLGLSEVTFAVLIAVSAICTVVVSMWIGIFTDQTGRYKDVLLGSLFIGCIGNALLFLLPTKLMFAVVMIAFFPVAGTGISQFFALARLAVNRSGQLDGEFSAAAVRAAFAGAYAITPPIWAVLILQGIDLLTIFGITAIINLLVMVVIQLMWPPQDARPPTKRSDVGFAIALKDLADAGLAVRLVLIMIIGSLTNLNSTMVGLIILTELGGNEADVGWFAGSVALLEIPIMLASASALRLVTKPVLIMIGVVVFGLYLGTFQFLSSTTYLWLLVFPASLGGGIFIALIIGYIQDLVSDQPGTGGALISISNIGGHVFTAIIFGICTTFVDYAATALIGALCAVLASFTLVILDRRQECAGQTIPTKN